MARIKKELVAQREEEVIQAFVNGASVKEANEALFTKYGKRMGLARIYELRTQVKSQVAAQVETVTPTATTTEAPVVAEADVAVE